jgi:ABC-type Zn uptake system ZnuABC Zn-binding protein ZnuA
VPTMERRTRRGRGRAPGARALAATLAIVSLAVIAAGCGADAAGGADDGRLEVATTVAPITSIAATIGGDRVDITGIVPEGTNSHTFEPKPSVAELLSTADVVYINGLSLEDPTKELAEENLKEGAAVVELGTQTIPESDYLYDFSFPKSGGEPNPHLWTDPLLARRYAQIISEDLAMRDPGNAAYYRSNYTKFSAQIDAFDKAMRTSFATIPAAKRRLLTYHDAYAYFAKDYGWTVIGAIQVDNFEDPTPREVVDLIDQVRQQKVPAIFGSEVFPSPVLEQIGKETGVTYVDVLRDDDLPGAPGDPEHSWVGLMDLDYVTMTEAMGGDASALKAFTPADVAPDTADYPQ